MTKNKRVFVFDDNTDILELCTIILEDAGYDIKTSSTSNNIIEQVMAYTPDIIFMDNWLPDVGGIDATRALKAHESLKGIPVIYFSANNDVKSLADQAKSACNSGVMIAFSRCVFSTATLSPLP
jgi:two-component system alkaline phosphatase synthesis response regulator PhoP